MLTYMMIPLNSSGLPRFLFSIFLLTVNKHFILFSAVWWSEKEEVGSPSVVTGEEMFQLGITLAITVIFI